MLWEAAAATLPELRVPGTIFFGVSPGQAVIQIANYCNVSCPRRGMIFLAAEGR
jgi:hypothetical protein